MLDDALVPPNFLQVYFKDFDVSILIVLDDALVQSMSKSDTDYKNVSILIVLDDALVLTLLNQHG